MIASQIMNRKIVTVEMDDGLHVINDIFRHVKFHHLLVIQGKSLVGVISDRDFLKAISPFIHTLSEREQDRATLNLKAHQIMTRNPITAYKNEKVETVANKMFKNNISCIPIVNKNGNVEGIITIKDILKWFLSKTGYSTQAERNK